MSQPAFTYFMQQYFQLLSLYQLNFTYSRDTRELIEILNGEEYLGLDQGTKLKRITICSFTGLMIEFYTISDEWHEKMKDFMKYCDQYIHGYNKTWHHFHRARRGEPEYHVYHNFHLQTLLHFFFRRGLVEYIPLPKELRNVIAEYY